MAVDACSKWPEVKEMSSTTAKQIVTDNGPQFVSEEFCSFLREREELNIFVRPPTTQLQKDQWNGSSKLLSKLSRLGGRKESFLVRK